MRALIHPYGFLLVQYLVERRLRHLTIVDWNFKQISKESLAIETSDLLYTFTLVYN